jgi:hypothetical protein
VEKGFDAKNVLLTGKTTTGMVKKKYHKNVAEPEMLIIE